MLNWNTTLEDSQTITAIADRFMQFVGLPREYKLTVIMDIESTHNNGCKLNLYELLKADDYNFIHDVNGIRRHINRNTGKLEDCFIPRYAE